MKLETTRILSGGRADILRLSVKVLGMLNETVVCFSHATKSVANLIFV